MTLEQLKEYLEKRAAKRIRGDDPSDFGSNTSDAYEAGVDDGETYMAQEILAKLKGE